MKRTFENIAGYKNEKKDLQNIVKILKNIKECEKMGLRMPKGLLLIGDPGVGKTVMAQTLINESGFNCVKIDFNAVDKNELSEYLNTMFKEAIRKGPSIVFLDELDKMCGEADTFSVFADIDNSRILLKAINDNESDKIMLIGTINDKNMLHPALYRSGRFDRIITIPLPSFEDRKEIINLYKKGKQFDSKVDFETIAKLTNNFSGADIETIINEAGLNAVINDRKIIKQEDIDTVINRMLFQAAEKPNNLNKQEREIVATHEAGHLIAGLMLDKDNIGFVSIIPQGESAGHVKIGNTDSGVKTKNEILNEVIIALSGKASEKIFFDNEYVGSCKDVLKAVSIVKKLVTLFGAYGFEYCLPETTGSFHQENISNEKLKKIEDKCNEILNECFDKAQEIIKNNVNLIKIYIEKLTKQSTLSRETILKIYNKEMKKATCKVA